MIRFFGPKAPRTPNSDRQLAQTQAMFQPLMAAAAESAAMQEAKRKQRSLLAETPATRVASSPLGAGPRRSLLGN